MLPDIDLFDLFRWLLAISCTVYAAVQTWQTCWRWMDYFTSSRRGMVLGRYVMVQLLRVRLRRFALEVLQIAVLLAALGLVIYGHRAVG